MIRSGSLRMHRGVFLGAVLVGLQSVPALAQCRVGQTAKLLASDAATGATFGERVAKFGEKILIGAQRADGVGMQSGSAYLFGREEGPWVERIKLTASDAAELDWFGASVSLDRDLAIIGAPQVFNDGPGAAYVFRFDGSTWNEEAKLVASDGDPAPLDPSELTFLATDTRTPYVAAFGGADANQVAHYMLRWESTRGEPGPWSETASATIGA